MTTENFPRVPTRVVVVDDNLEVLGLLTRALTAVGHDVTACASFEEGKTAVARSTPDVVIVDIRLGGFNGLQLIFMVRDKHPQVRAVAITGFDDLDLRREAAKMGATFLVKPFSAAAIQAAVHQAVSSRV